VRENNQIKGHLFDIDKDLLMIPNVAIHMNRSINDGFKYNKQIDMLPLFSMKNNQEEPFLELLAQHLKVDKNDILTYDLYLYNRAKGVIWGYDDEFIGSKRLDDLQCVYPSIKAIIDTKANNSINVCCCFDNEEVGSGTMQGAAGTFLLDTLERINSAFGKSSDELKQALATSLMVSADNAHAVHPNHLELSDRHNCVYMNKGVVIKFNASQRYTSDGFTASLFMNYCDRAKVPYQFFTNRSDQLGGGTLGAISTSQVSVPSVDVGLPQLAMHSAYETAGVEDTYSFYKVLVEFYSSYLSRVDDGNMVISKNK
jgi:Aspartyl aminopeptidase